MQVLVLGLGSIGMRHARNFKALGASAVIGFDPTQERRARFQSEIGGTSHDDLAAALAQRPGLVVVASPNRFHIPQAMAAVEAGLPLFIEKPLGTELAPARELARLIEAKGLYCHSGSNWKFHPAFQTLKRLVNDGTLGRMSAMQVIAGQWLPDWHPWEDFRHGYSARKDLGGGAIFDTHELDYMFWLAGPARRFTGYAAPSGFLPIETEDNAVAVMELGNGALGTLQTDYIQRQGLRRYTITGENGTLEWSTRTNRIAFRRPRQGENAEGQLDLDLDVSLADINEMYVSQSRRVLEDLASGAQPETPLSHVLEVLARQIEWRGDLPA